MFSSFFKILLLLAFLLCYSSPAIASTLWDSDSTQWDQAIWDQESTPLSGTPPSGLDLAADDDTGTSSTDNITNKTALTITGKGDGLVLAELFDNGAAIAGASVQVGGDGNFTLDITLAEGVHSLTAVLKDSFGSVSEASAPLQVTVDLTPPVITSEPEGGKFGYEATNPALPVKLQTNEDGLILYTTSSQLDPLSQGDEYLSTIYLQKTSRIYMASKDAAGNIGEKQALFEFDWIFPAAPVIKAEKNTASGISATPTFVWEPVAAADLDHYVLQYSDDPDFKTNVITLDNLKVTSHKVASDLSAEGTWLWRVRAVDEAGNQSDWSTAAYNYAKEGLIRKAIIVAGGGGFDGNSLWETTKKCANYAFDTLRHRDYSPSNDRLKYLSHEASSVNNRVTGAATNNDFRTLLTDWAADSGELVVYINDHGGQGKFRMGENEWLEAVELDSWLDTLQTSNPDLRIIFIYEACRSGSFLTPLKATGTQQRVLISSASSNENAWLLSGGTLSFSWFFWSNIDAGHTVKESFVRAKDNIKVSFSGKQQALLDADSDTVPNEKGDYLLVNNLYIGIAVFAAADRPEIGGPLPPVHLAEETSYAIKVTDVQGSNDIDEVRAIIISPTQQSVDPDTPITEMPSILLTDIGNGSYMGTYNDFTAQGIYNITIYATDSAGLMSLPVKMRVVKGTTVKGDLNGDSTLDQADLDISLKTTSGKDVSGELWENYQDSGTDADGDDTVKMEALYLLQKMLKIR